jgi:hypothetical protein
MRRLFSLTTIAAVITSAALLACSSSTESPRGTAATIRLMPDSALVQMTAVQQFTATPLDGSGNPAPGVAIAWSADPPDAAIIDGSGRLVAIAPSGVTVTATGGGASAMARVTIPPFASYVLISVNGKPVPALVAAPCQGADPDPIKISGGALVFHDASVDVVIPRSQQCAFSSWSASSTLNLRLRMTGHAMEILSPQATPFPAISAVSIQGKDIMLTWTEQDNAKGTSYTLVFEK